MNYPVRHRVSIDGHPCWPFRWEHERAAQGMAPEGRGREGGPGSSELPSPVPKGCAQNGDAFIGDK